MRTRLLAPLLVAASLSAVGCGDTELQIAGDVKDFTVAQAKITRFCASAHLTDKTSTEDMRDATRVITRLMRRHSGDDILAREFRKVAREQLRELRRNECGAEYVDRIRNAVDDASKHQGATG